MEIELDENYTKKKRGYHESNINSRELEDIESKLKRLKLPDSIEEIPFEIRIKSITGQIYQIKVESEELVISLKSKLESCVGTPFTQTRLIYKGRVMSDLFPLSHYGINETSIIHIVYSLRGGI